MGDREIDVGTPGASARREGERRREKREAATRERHPRVGNFLLRFQETPSSERAWSTGAQGEEELARHLAKRCPEAIVLHDRRIPGSRANIDHLAVAASGVHVIDAKRYRGKIEVVKPFFGDPQLLIKGRRQTRLLEGLKRQREQVRAALDERGLAVPVRACFCFLNPEGQAGGSGLPLLRTPRIEDVPLFVPRKLSKSLNQPGELDAGARERLAERLASAFPRA